MYVTILKNSIRIPTIDSTFVFGLSQLIAPRKLQPHLTTNALHKISKSSISSRIINQSIKSSMNQLIKCISVYTHASTYLCIILFLFRIEAIKTFLKTFLFTIVLSSCLQKTLDVRYSYSSCNNQTNKMLKAAHKTLSTSFLRFYNYISCLVFIRIRIYIKLAAAA